MLKFAESVLKDVRDARKSTEEFVLGGTVTNMERYKFLMGRLEGLNLAEEIIRERLKKHSDEQF